MRQSGRREEPEKETRRDTLVWIGQVLKQIESLQSQPVNKERRRRKAQKREWKRESEETEEIGNWDWRRQMGWDKAGGNGFSFLRSQDRYLIFLVLQLYSDPQTW